MLFRCRDKQQILEKAWELTVGLLQPTVDPLLFQSCDRSFVVGNRRKVKVPSNCEAARTGYYDRQKHTDSNQVILEALAGLGAGPVHKEAKLAVHSGDSAEHDDNDRRRGKSRKEAENDAEAAEELADADQVSKRPHHLNNGGKAGSPESSKEFL